MAKEKSLTLAQLRGELKEYTKDVLLPATFKQLTEYTTEILLPAISGVIDVRIKKFENKTNNDFDKVFKDLEMLKQGKVVGEEQEKRKKKFHEYIVKHMETGSTSKEELAEILKLDIF